MIKSVIYLSDRVKNKYQRGGEADYYYPIKLMKDGKLWRYALLTEHQLLEVGVRRAERNLEDVRPTGGLLRWISKAFKR